MPDKRETPRAETGVPGVVPSTAVTRSERREPPGRPEHVLESHEDEIYHDLDLGDRATEPEYYAFVGRSWVFNRAMRWVRTAAGNIICYEAAGALPLTGDGQVSEWFSDPANTITQQGGRLRFEKRSRGRRRDCAVLPGLQFNVEQHSTAVLDVSEATHDWQFAVFVKGRSGPPLLTSGWRTGPGSCTFDIGEALRSKGHALHFAELHFAVGLWCDSPEEAGTIAFALRLRPRPAVVPCLPVIRTAQQVEEGMPVAAVVVDEQGVCLGDDAVALAAEWDGGRVALAESDGVWTGAIAGLPVGDHEVVLVAQGAVEARSSLSVRVTDGRFLGYDAAAHSLTRGGAVLGPLSGSYQGLVYVHNVGRDDEAMVQGEEAFQTWDRTKPPGEHWHYWEALTEKELAARFRFLAANGWRLLHLCQHWGAWEKLDAGGHIAPHGAEQVALYYRTAARYGLAVVQALSHYPYGSGDNATPPFRQTIEAGFRDSDWTEVSSSFTERFHAYLADYATLFRDETAVAWLTASGEGDIAAGPDRVNDTCRCLSEHDPNHLFLSEPIHKMTKLPAEHAAGWEQPMYGSRLYWIGDEIEPELDQGIEYKFMQLVPTFVGEGSWPCPHLYADFSGEPRTWCATPEYRTRVRDSLCFGLVYRSPALLTWEEQLTEDEHRLLEEIRCRVDWAQPFMVPPVAVRVDSRHVRGGRQTLACYEEFFSAMPLAACYLAPNEEPPEGVQCVLDARAEFVPPAFEADGGEIPDEVRQVMPLRISPGYRACYAWSRDRRTLLAYVCNRTAHLDCVYPLGGRIHRLPRSTPLELTLRHFPCMPLAVRMYDLSAKTLVGERTFEVGTYFDVGRTQSDYFVLVTPVMDR